MMEGSAKQVPTSRHSTNYVLLRSRGLLSRDKQRDWLLPPRVQTTDGYALRRPSQSERSCVAVSHPASLDQEDFDRWPSSPRDAGLNSSEELSHELQPPN